MLKCPPVQSFHNTTANFRVHASVAFLVNSDERPLLMVYFLKCLETSPFRWRWFCRCAINRLGHAFYCTQNVFTNGVLIPIYSACSFVETSEKLLLLCLSCMYRAILRVNLYYFCLSRMRNASKVTLVSSGKTLCLGKNLKRSVCCCFSWMTESGTFERISVFPERAIDFHDFQQQIR